MSNFTVTNETNGRVFEVYANETVLESALRQGFSLPYSCRNGTCAACMATLVSGWVEHEEYDKAALSDSQLESSKILLCRAKPRQDLVIRADEIDALDNIVIQSLPSRISSLEKLTHDVMKVTLTLPRDTIFNYISGQYIDVILRDGRRRGFSIANAPSINQDLELHIRHVPNGRFTTRVFQGTKVRDIIRFEGPLGTFFLRESSARNIVLIGGGTGFAPLNAIIETALSMNSNQKLHLFWGVRTMRDFYFQDQISAWLTEHGDRFKYTPVLSEPKDSDEWSGSIGWVHDIVLEHYSDLSDLEVYASGPPPMIEAIRTVFPQHGLSEDQLFYDSFEYSSDTLYPSQSS